MSSTPSIGVIAVFRYNRAPVIVSKESATERIRAPNGMTFPFNPAGYPDPSQRSWWWRTSGATSARAECCAIISAPMSGCLRMISHSSSLRGPGLLRMSSRTPIFPRSCKEPAVRIKSTSYDALLIACPHATFTGTADVNGVSKKYQVDVDDMDEPGSSPGVGPDTFTIRVLDDTYMATGPLVGGNIQVHKPPECG